MWTRRCLVFTSVHPCTYACTQRELEDVRPACSNAAREVVQEITVAACSPMGIHSCPVLLPSRATRKYTKSEFYANPKRCWRFLDGKFKQERQPFSEKHFVYLRVRVPSAKSFVRWLPADTTVHIPTNHTRGFASTRDLQIFTRNFR